MPRRLTAYAYLTLIYTLSYIQAVQAALEDDDPISISTTPLATTTTSTTKRKQKQTATTSSSPTASTTPAPVSGAPAFFKDRGGIIVFVIFMHLLGTLFIIGILLCVLSRFKRERRKLLEMLQEKGLVLMPNEPDRLTELPSVMVTRASAYTTASSGTQPNVAAKGRMNSGGISTNSSYDMCSIKSGVGTEK